MGRPKSVLLVDDDDTTNFLNRFFLRQVDSSIEINSVVNGKEAIEFLALNGKDDIMPCLLILDVHMPVMNGWQFLEAFEQKFDERFKKNVTIIMLTSLNVEQATIKAMAHSNVADTAEKPLSDLKLRALLKKHF